MPGVDGAGAARRRRERRLRAYLRYARMSVAMALAETTHHTTPRGQKTARAGEEAREALHGHVPEAPLSQEERPPPLVEVRPQGTLVQDSGIGFELVQALHVPVLQMVKVVSFFRNSLLLVAKLAAYVSSGTAAGGTVDGSADRACLYWAGRRHSSSSLSSSLCPWRSLRFSHKTANYRTDC